MADKKGTFTDEDGKVWNLKDFDDTHSWSKAKDDKGFYGHMGRKGEGVEYKWKDGGDIMNPDEELKETK